MPGFFTDVGLSLRVECNDREAGGHTFDQRKAESFVAKRQQHIGSPIPVRDAACRFFAIDEVDANVIRLVVGDAET